MVTNFAYGTGPYLRTTELAIAFNEELEKRGRARFGIVVPLVYGKKQAAIMLEEFSEHIAKHPGEIILDEGLGKILKKLFYEGGPFGAYLDGWSRMVSSVSIETNKFLRIKYGDNIKIELNRSPRVSFNVAPSYFTSFGYIGEILEETRKNGNLKFSAHVLNAAIEQINFIEKNQKIHCLAFPGTFSHINNHKPRYQTEKKVPPLVTPFLTADGEVDRGIFVTVSGIPGLEKMYSAATKLGLKVYSNDPDAIPGSIKASPKIIASGNIVLHFTRAGWNSVWLSLFSGTPLVLPGFDSNDDPEIYFNNVTIQKLGLGIVYYDQTAEELLEECEKIKNKNLAIKKEIIDRWGTFDGTKYCAKIFVEDYLKNNE